MMLHTGLNGLREGNYRRMQEDGKEAGSYTQRRPTRFTRACVES
jgi:hypothetical protein